MKGFCGYSDGFRTAFDYVTIKYDQSGNQLWVSNYNFSPVNKHDYAYSLTIDDSGNVYVTGASSGQTKFDYATIKYDVSGNQLWVKRCDHMCEDDFSYDIALDISGNVYVTGDSASGTGLDYATVKYDPTGTQLWVNRYDGAKKHDIARSIAICDFEGKVFVTGSSHQGIVRKLDYATLKFDATTGTTDWVGRYNWFIKDDIAYNVRLRVVQFPGQYRHQFMMMRKMAL